MTDEKALEKYTVAKLKEIARDTGKIVGFTSMKKDDLIQAIRSLQDEGMETTEDAGSEPMKIKPEKKASKKPGKPPENVASLKKMTGLLRQEKAELQKDGTKVIMARLRKRISRLKKKTRKLARTAR